MTFMQSALLPSPHLVILVTVQVTFGDVQVRLPVPVFNDAVTAFFAAVIRWSLVALDGATAAARAPSAALCDTVCLKLSMISETLSAKMIATAPSS